MSTPKNWSSATPTATAAQRTRPPTTIVRSSTRRTRSGTTRASSAYSPSLRKLTRWSSKRASSSDAGRNVANASHASRATPGIQRSRAGWSRASPNRAAAKAAVTTTTRTAASESLTSTEVEPDVDRELGLIALVEKQERQRCSENERPESVAVEEVADLGSHERAFERRGRHRATIEATIAGRSLRRVRSLH